MKGWPDAEGGYVIRNPELLRGVKRQAEHSQFPNVAISAMTILAQHRIGVVAMKELKGVLDNYWREKCSG